MGVIRRTHDHCEFPIYIYIYIRKTHLLFERDPSSFSLFSLPGFFFCVDMPLGEQELTDSLPGSFLFAF
jgi:hypothetical protein